MTRLDQLRAAQEAGLFYRAGLTDGFFTDVQAVDISDLLALADAVECAVASGYLNVHDILARLRVPAGTTNKETT